MQVAMGSLEASFEVYHGEAESLMHSPECQRVDHPAQTDALIHLRMPICILANKHIPLWLCLSVVFRKV